MNDRLKIGHEVRELKLGSTFAPQNSQTAFHTIKYDFKPASVDLNKVATLDVGSNNQVTVTVPNIESSGVPHTVFKGNQRKYTKECIIIFDKKTGVMTLEKLNHNIQVKKTRSETASKNVITAPLPPPPPSQKFENNTQRTSSKTRVSTGIRKNAIIGFVPRNLPMQGSPSTHSTNHKSPQSAPVWNANNGQSTLPSIPLIEVEEDIGMPSGSGNNSLISSTGAIGGNSNSDFHHHHHHQQQQQQQQQYQNNHNQNNVHGHHGNSNLQSSLSNNINSGHHTSLLNVAREPDRSLENAAAALEQNMVGVLSSSDSSSDTDSSGSGSDSDDSCDDNDNERQIVTTTTQKTNVVNQKHHHNSSNNQQKQEQQSYTNGGNGNNVAGGGFPALLHDDLQLSESNSSSSDSDDSGDDDDDDDD